MYTLAHEKASLNFISAGAQQLHSIKFTHALCYAFAHTSKKVQMVFCLHLSKCIFWGIRITGRYSLKASKNLPIYFWAKTIIVNANEQMSILYLAILYNFIEILAVV